MASFSIFRFIIGIILLVNLVQGKGGEFLFEEGYTVTTVIDGDKLHINPYSVFSLYGSSSDLIVLDSVKSTFYTVSFSDSQVSTIKELSGNGVAGYKDGDLASAMFNKPKSFALDRKNNIYIADKTNHVIRKISKSGVTTIAGGYVQKTGKQDGPAQNASFSDDFELAFDPQRCALLISDHGNRLVRQLDLKADDCSASSSGSGLGSTAAWGIGVVVACIVGLIIGFAIRPYVLPHETSGDHRFSKTWRPYLINLEKQAVTFYFVIRSAIASHKLHQLPNKLLRLSVSLISLVFGLNMIRPPPTPVKPVSLLDCDDGPQPTPVRSLSLLDSDNLGDNESSVTRDLVNELKDLVALDGVVESKPLLDREIVYGVENEVSGESGGKLDRQIYANFVGFVEGSKQNSSLGIGS